MYRQAKVLEFHCKEEKPAKIRGNVEGKSMFQLSEHSDVCVGEQEEKVLFMCSAIFSSAKVKILGKIFLRPWAKVSLAVLLLLCNFWPGCVSGRQMHFFFIFVLILSIFCSGNYQWKLICWERVGGEVL